MMSSHVHGTSEPVKHVVIDVDDDDDDDNADVPDKGDSSLKMALPGTASGKGGPPPVTPKLALSPPPLKKSKSMAIFDDDADEDDCSPPDLPSGPLIPAGHGAITDPNVDPQPLMQMLNHWAERLEGNLSHSLG